EHRGSRQDILDIARSSLEELGYWPLPAETGDEPASPVEALGVQPPQEPVGEVSAGTEDTAATVAAFIDRAPAEPAGDDAGTDAQAEAVEAVTPAPVGGRGATQTTGDQLAHEL